MGLSIYNASAGSGKTYTITREYLQWLLSGTAAGAFRSVLAVTFTNKATEEMKSRIINGLNEVAENPEAAMGASLCEALHLTSGELGKRAVALRTAILHDYSHFSVSTIDKFFQKIIRAFMHEAGLLPEFTVELDTNRLLEEGIERLLQTSGQDAILKKWLHALVEKRMEDGRHWDVRKELKSIGEEVFKESFRRLGHDFQEKLKDKKFLTAYVDVLKKITGNFEKEMDKQGTKALQILKEEGLQTTDFKHKGGSFANYFHKIKQGKYEMKSRVLEAQNDISNWYSSEASKNGSIEKVYPVLNDCLTQAIAYYEKEFIPYNTARQILRNVHSMGLLADIANHVAELAKEENVMALSDSLYLLYKLISGNDTPFIYEKSGSHFRSFMLDEFQDTSDMQWNSLKPLLENGLSEGGNALVVGDVKQSIYRWRNGDWRILSYGLDNDLGMFGAEHVVLDTNWRSAPVIIQTNNELFEKLPQLLRQRLLNSFADAGFSDEQLSNALVEAYENVAQHAAKKQDEVAGYVHIEALSGEEELSAADKALLEVRKLVAELQSRGYRLSDIGVLVRKNKEGQAVADALLEDGIPVISQESQYIIHSPAVQFITGLLYQAIYRDDKINRKCIENFLIKKGITLTSDFDEWLAELAQQPLAEAVETIIARFRPDEPAEEVPYVQELHDLVLSYCTRETGDIYSFVEWWAEKGEKQTLSIANEQDAVRILTIHRAKGLQFRVVIIPFCSWPLEPKKETLLWAQCHEPPFNELPYLPLNYMKDLANTHFRTAYFTEKSQTYIDNLNVLYVAFTRAEEELYVFAPRSGNNSYSVGSLLQESLGNPCFEAGIKLPKVSESTGKKEQSISLNQYPSYAYVNHLRLRYADDKETEEAATSLRDYGILMHRAFSEIFTTDDVDKAIDSLVLQGLIANDKQTLVELRQNITEALKQPDAAPWFDGSWNVHAEADILLPHTGEPLHRLRPDRVMTGHGKVVVVDYKFGENEQEVYEGQVKRYISCLKSMGYEKVEGYLWYVGKKKVIPIIF